MPPFLPASTFSAPAAGTVCSLISQLLCSFPSFQTISPSRHCIEPSFFWAKAVQPTSKRVVKTNKLNLNNLFIAVLLRSKSLVDNFCGFQRRNTTAVRLVAKDSAAKWKRRGVPTPPLSYWQQDLSQSNHGPAAMTFGTFLYRSMRLKLPRCPLTT